MASSSTSPDKGKITLSGAHETLLLTLQIRATDAESPSPILNDQLALQITRRLREAHGYDFASRAASGSTKNLLTNMVTMRGKVMDQAVEAFLRDNPGPATVLHLACGLDTRCQRVKWWQEGEGRVWIDADMEEVIRLRREVMEPPQVPEGRGEYRLVAPDIIHDVDWMSEIRVPTDRPVLVLFEGLIMYLTSEEVVGLMQTIVRHFGGGGGSNQIVFDSVGSITYFWANLMTRHSLQRMGATFSFYMSDGGWMERKVSGLRLVKRLALLTALVDFWGCNLLVRTAARVIDYLFGNSTLGGVYAYKF